MATRGSYVHISMGEFSGHPDNVSFMQFSMKQGFENSYNSYEQYPLEKFLIFTIYQNYTLALINIKNIQQQQYGRLNTSIKLRYIAMAGSSQKGCDPYKRLT